MGLADEHTECAAGETMEVETEIRARVVMLEFCSSRWYFLWEKIRYLMEGVQRG